MHDAAAIYMYSKFRRKRSSTLHVLIDDRKQNDLCILLDIHAYKCIIYSAFPQSGSMWPFFNLSGPLRRKVLQLAVTLLHRSIQPQDTLSSTMLIV